MHLAMLAACHPANSAGTLGTAWPLPLLLQRHAPVVLVLVLLPPHSCPVLLRCCAFANPPPICPQARIDAQAESFDRTYSVPEAMDAPLLESALPVRGGGRG